MKQIILCFRIVTGSFDKTVRIWSPDGKLVHTLENFLSTVTDVCYVPKNKTIWAAGGTSYAYIYDPKSGENVSVKLYSNISVRNDEIHDNFVKINNKFWTNFINGKFSRNL